MLLPRTEAVLADFPREREDGGRGLLWGWGEGGWGEGVTMVTVV